jgi:mannan endo-1,4-beta-mannosidase
MGPRNALLIQKAISGSILFLLPVLLFISCHPKSVKNQEITIDSSSVILPVERPADTLLTRETRSLWLYLFRTQGKGILFGQQDATVSGVDWKIPDEQSDVRLVTGEYPAIYGWEISGIGKLENIDSIPFDLLRQRIVEAFERGGVNTVTWHMGNPVTGGNAWDTEPAVQDILPDSSLNAYYASQLEKVGTFFRQLKTPQGIQVPIIFRPFHENNGNWFWWGKGHCTPDEYIRLFEYEDQYLERYPGNDWVDILGCENYWDFQSGATISNGIAQLRELVEMAAERKKLAALTECGFEGIPVKNWWTQYLLTPIKNDSIARNISYLMVWRNENRKHYYVPYPDQKSAPDFIQFSRDTFTLFENNLKNVYRISPGH